MFLTEKVLNTVDPGQRPDFELRVCSVVLTRLFLIKFSEANTLLKRNWYRNCSPKEELTALWTIIFHHQFKKLVNRYTALYTLG